MPYKNPLDLADAIQTQYQPFKLDKTKYPDVEETPYGFIYNVGGRSITDHSAMRKFYNQRGSDPFGDYDANKDYGWTLNTPENDEVFYPSFEDAYKAAKGGE